MYITRCTAFLLHHQSRQASSDLPLLLEMLLHLRLHLLGHLRHLQELSSLLPAVLPPRHLASNFPGLEGCSIAAAHGELPSSSASGTALGGPALAAGRLHTLQPSLPFLSAAAVDGERLELQLPLRFHQAGELLLTIPGVLPSEQPSCRPIQCSTCSVAIQLIAETCSWRVGQAWPSNSWLKGSNWPYLAVPAKLLLEWLAVQATWLHQVEDL